jgi:hypothetical protein
MSTPPPNLNLAQLMDTIRNRKSVEVAFSYRPLLADTVARWLTLTGWAQGILPTFVFLLLQLLIIPLLVVFGILIPQQDKAKKKYPGDDVVIKGTSTSVLFACTLVVVGVGVVYQILSDLHILLRILLTLASFPVYTFFVITIYASSASLSPPAVKLNRTRESKFDPAQLSLVDRNDLQIVSMETEVQSITQRVEAYTLESTLFGALAFSGFLTLLSSEHPVMGALQQFTASSKGWWASLRVGAIPNIRVNFDQELGIIAIETLLCSMFFLAVVLSRLRFYSMLHRVQYAVQAARAWNNKEEEVANIRLSATTVESDERLEQLSDLVAGAIEHAEPLIQDLMGITRYISVFRNLGVLMFLIVLFTSAFVISPTLGMIFLAIAAVAFLYSSFDHWLRHRKLRRIPFFRAISQRAQH